MDHHQDLGWRNRPKKQPRNPNVGDVTGIPQSNQTGPTKAPAGQTKRGLTKHNLETDLALGLARSAGRCGHVARVGALSGGGAGGQVGRAVGRAGGRDLCLVGPICGW